MLRVFIFIGCNFAKNFTNMKAIIVAFLMFLIAVVAVAQESVDTIATRQLKEVVIQAPKIIRKADMDVYYPSRSAVDNS